VIGIILMVAITIVLAAILWLMVSEMTAVDQDVNTTINLAYPQVSQKLDNTTRWNVRIDINKITPDDVRVLWTEVKVIVKDYSGSVLDPATDVASDTGGPYSNSTSFWYVETTTGDIDVGAGDGILITGIDSSYEAATVELVKAGERIASMTLPTNFP
jgi:FlaG/FlaF family flagellin (archaellin)